MGYCFHLRYYDLSGNFIDRYEYAGSYGIGTMENFLNELHTLCQELWIPLPDEALHFLGNQTYHFVECVEILECLETLKMALKEGSVKWTENHRKYIFKEFLKIFQKAVKIKGYVEQHLSE